MVCLTIYVASLTVSLDPSFTGQICLSLQVFPSVDNVRRSLEGYMGRCVWCKVLSASVTF